MYLITNRDLRAESGGVEIFDSKPNRLGGNELRIVEVTGPLTKLRAKALKDELSQSRVAALKKQFDLKIDETRTWYASLEVACRLFKKASDEGKHLLLYVHGYNNNVKDVVATARRIERQYKDVIVVPFTWPAKGGGAISGAANYIDDKRDARASEGALDRVFEAVYKLHALLVESQTAHLWERATQRFPDNHERARSEYVKLQSRVCRVSINLLCHSMGNYVLKHATLPTGARIRRLIFDNVALVAADTNNVDHARWVGVIESRGGTYVVINEDDYALQWSRRKPGEEQLARLGHHLRGLNAANATYIDVTETPHVRDDHSYYNGPPVEKNAKLRRVFHDIFTGRRPEHAASRLRYHAEINAYRTT